MIGRYLFRTKDADIRGKNTDTRISTTPDKREKGP